MRHYRSKRWNEPNCKEIQFENILRQKRTLHSHTRAKDMTNQKVQTSSFSFWLFPFNFCNFHAFIHHSRKKAITKKLLTLVDCQLRSIRVGKKGMACQKKGLKNYNAFRSWTQSVKTATLLVRKPQGFYCLGTTVPR